MVAEKQFLEDLQDLCLCAVSCFRRAGAYADPAIVNLMSPAAAAKSFVAK